MRTQTVQPEPIRIQDEVKTLEQLPVYVEKQRVYLAKCGPAFTDTRIAALQAEVARQQLLIDGLQAQLQAECAKRTQAVNDGAGWRIDFHKTLTRAEQAEDRVQELEAELRIERTRREQAEAAVKEWRAQVMGVRQ